LYNSRAGEGARAQVVERVPGLAEWVGLDLNADRDAGRQVQELLAVATGQVGDGAQDALAPQQLVGE
jgi:hypothetical protein